MKNLLKFLSFPFVLVMCVSGTLIAFAGMIFLGIAGLTRVVHDTMRELYEDE